MLRPRTLVASLILAMLPACGSPPEAASPSGASEAPDSTAETAKGAPSAEPEAALSGTEKPAGEPAKAEAAPEAAPSEHMTLARDFLKSGGRKIAYSATKKGFAYPVEQRQESGFGLDIQFIGDDGRPRDSMRVCQIGECEEHLDELAKEIIPKLAARFEQDGYVAIRGIGWPSGRDELEVNSLSMKLKYTKGRLEALREGKPAARVTQVGTKRLDSTSLLAVFLVPDSKIIGVFATPGADAKGLLQDFYIFKLPG